MAAKDPRIRNIKIKSGVLKRLVKEKAMYGKEIVDQIAKIEKMKAEEKDAYDIKKQQEVLEESKMMIPDCTRRITVAFKDLQNVLETAEDVQEEEDYKTATALIEEETAEDVQEEEDYKTATALIEEVSPTI